MQTLIKFYADWCQPCKNMQPIVDQLKQDYSQDIIFTEVNIEDNPSERQKYFIRSIPAFVLVENQEEVSRKVGSTTLEGMREWLDEYRRV